MAKQQQTTKQTQGAVCPLTIAPVKSIEDGLAGNCLLLWFVVYVLLVVSCVDYFVCDVFECTNNQKHTQTSRSVA